MVNGVAQQQILKGYTQTEVGVIPVEWSVGRFPDYVWYQEGPGLRNWQFTNKGMKVINVTNLQYSGLLNLDKTDRHISIEEFEKMYRHFECDEGDFVVASSGNSYCKTSVVRRCDLPLVMNTSVIRFKPRKGTANGYMQAYMKSKYFKQQIDLLITGGAQPNFGPAHLNKVLLPIPASEKEQTAIGNALSDVDTLIASLEKLIAKKRAIKTAAMQQLLTGKKRLPPFDTLASKDNPDGKKRGYKQTELGEIPEDWEVRTIQSISSVPMQNGLFYEPSRKGRGVRLINVGDLYASAPINVDELELFAANKIEISTFRVTNGDLFFTRSSIVPTGIAYCNIYEAVDSRMDVVFDSHLIRVRVDGALADAKYIYLACMSNIARRFLISSAKTATMTTIDQGAIKSCPVLLPPKAEQVAISSLLSDMDTEIEVLAKRLNKTQQIKQGMMQELLTGRTRLV